MHVLDVLLVLKPPFSHTLLFSFSRSFKQTPNMYRRSMELKDVGDLLEAVNFTGRSVTAESSDSGNTQAPTTPEEDDLSKYLFAANPDLLRSMPRCV